MNDCINKTIDIWLVLAQRLNNAAFIYHMRAAHALLELL